MALTVILGEDDSLTKLLIKIAHVIFRVDLEAVERWLVLGEGLAMWVVEVGIGVDVVELVVAVRLGEALELDLDGQDCGGGEDHEGEVEEFNHFDGWGFDLICEHDEVSECIEVW